MTDIPYTTKVRSAHTLDVPSLEKYLKSNVKKFGTKIVDLKQFEGGQSNPTYYLKDDKGSEFVLRKKPPGQLLPSAHAVDREYHIMSALKGLVPVPDTYCLCTDDSVVGTTFYLCEYMRGRVLQDMLLPSLSAKDRRLVYEQLTTVLAKLHNVNISAVGLDNFAKSENYGARQIKRWTEQYKSSIDTKIPSMEKLIKWLPNNLPPENYHPSIVHGDWKLNNVVFHPTEMRIIAVLDWELATLGNPLADFSYLIFPYFHEKSLGPMVGLKNRETAGIPTKEELIKIYCRERKLEGLSRDLVYWVVLSMFRLASILVGVGSRAKKGNASSDMALVVGNYAVKFSDTACEIIKEYEQVFLQRSISMRNLIGFPISEKAKKLHWELLTFMNDFVYPAEAVFAKYELENHTWSPNNRWVIPPLLEELKTKAKERGLWNLFLPSVSGLTNLDYAPLCEIMGRSFLAPVIFNCNAPDTGNMEVLEKYGNEKQKKQWLEPLLEGKIRSCFAMTEPDVASSDATNIQTKIEKIGNEYVINGSKWWTSGAGHPECKIIILMGKTRFDGPTHQQQSMILVPMNTPGVTLIKPLMVFGYLEAPFGHFRVSFDNVRVPVENLILSEGKGFEIAQGRLGPGRIHHCMRLIGLAERSHELMISRAFERTTFGRQIALHGTTGEKVANSRIEIDSCRLMVMQAAYAIDLNGAKNAKDQIAMIKICTPQMACRVIDRAIQLYGAAGVSEEFPLASYYANARTLRIADGPDEVHLMSLAKMEYTKYSKSKL